MESDRSSSIISKKHRLESNNWFAPLAELDQEDLELGEKFQILLILFKREKEQSLILQEKVLKLEGVVSSVEEKVTSTMGQMNYMTQHWGSVTQMVEAVREDLKKLQISNIESINRLQNHVTKMVTEMQRQNMHTQKEEGATILVGQQGEKESGASLTPMKEGEEVPFRLATVRGRPKVRLAVGDVDNQSTRSTSASVVRSTLSSNVSLDTKKTFKERLREAADDETAMRKLLFKSQPATITTDIWEVTLMFPFKQEAMNGGIANSMNSAIRLATGSNPLQIQILGKNRGRCFFDQAVHPRGMTEEKLARNKFSTVVKDWSKVDIPALASAYLNLGYFKQLRHAILPKDRNLLIQVMEKAEELASLAEPKGKRRQLKGIIQIDKQFLGILMQTTMASMEEAPLTSQSGGMET